MAQPAAPEFKLVLVGDGGVGEWWRNSAERLKNLAFLFLR